MPSYKIIERSDDLEKIEKEIKNKWKLVWCEEKDGNGDFLSEFVRKIDKPGKALCIFIKTIKETAKPNKTTIRDGVIKAWEKKQDPGLRVSLV